MSRGAVRRHTVGDDRQYADEFEHPAVEVREGEDGQRRARRHGLIWRITGLIRCLREGRPTDMNVYDAAALSGFICELNAALRAKPQPAGRCAGLHARAVENRRRRWALSRRKPPGCAIPAMRATIGGMDELARKNVRDWPAGVPAPVGGWTGGNFSVRVSENRVLCTPSGCSVRACCRRPTCA